jgi:hypothetical protein
MVVRDVVRDVGMQPIVTTGCPRATVQRGNALAHHEVDAFDSPLT